MSFFKKENVIWFFDVKNAYYTLDIKKFVLAIKQDFFQDCFSAELLKKVEEFAINYK
jgi:hypothetical protein